MGLEPPPFVLHQRLICQSILHCTACVVTKMMSYNGNVGRAIYMRMLTADEK